jgi:hypothetical protein
MNPAAAVRGPKHVVKTGKTPVLEAAEWRKLLRLKSKKTLSELAVPITKSGGLPKVASSAARDLSLSDTHRRRFW